MLFLGQNGFLPVRKKFGANAAYVSIATASRAVFPAVENDLQMELVPDRFVKELLEVHFGLHNGTTVGKPPSLSEPVDMCVDGKGRMAKTLTHYNRSRFVPHTRKSLKLLKGFRHLASMLFNQNNGQLLDGFGFLRAQSARLDDFPDTLNGLLCHIAGIVRQSPKGRCHTIDHFVRALRAQ